MGSRPNPLRSTRSRGYDVGVSLDGSHNNFHSSSGGTCGGGETSMVEQSGEEALNSLVEEMKEILGAPVYNLSPLQNVSEKFWLALDEAKKAGIKKEEHLEQALAKIKSDCLLAREEYEEQLSEERKRSVALSCRLNDMRFDRNGSPQHRSSHSPQNRNALHAPCMTHRPQSASSGGGGDNNSIQNHHNLAGMDPNGSPSFSHKNRIKNGRNGSNQSVVSMGSEFAQKAKSLVHLLNCQGKEA